MTLRNNEGTGIWRTVLVALAAMGAVFAFPANATNPNAFTCSAEDRILADSIRPGSVAQCPAGTATTKPAYELVCQDGALRFGCCRSACDCKFTAQVFGNKGWGTGSRSYKTYQIGGACPRPPTAPYPTTGGSTGVVK